MRRLCCLLCVVLLWSGRAGPAVAGTIELSWRTCFSSNVAHETLVPGGSATLYGWVSGQLEWHRGYAITLELSSPTGVLPQAWRFDAGGCQPEGSLEVHHRGPPVFTKCPDFAPTSTSTSSATSFDPDSGVLRIDLTHDYDPEPPAQSTSGRYWAADWQFNHRLSVYGSDGDPVTCNDADRLICIRVIRAAFKDAEGVFHDWKVATPVVTVAGEGVAPDPCLAVPAAAATWGRIKARYH